MAIVILGIMAWYWCSTNNSRIYGQPQPLHFNNPQPPIHFRQGPSNIRQYLGGSMNIPFWEGWQRAPKREDLVYSWLH